MKYIGLYITKVIAVYSKTNTLEHVNACVDMYLNKQRNGCLWHGHIKIQFLLFLILIFVNLTYQNI